MRLTNGYGTWITVDPQTRTLCAAYPPAERMRRLHQRFGLKRATPDDDKSMLASPSRQAEDRRRTSRAPRNTSCPPEPGCG